MGKELVRCQMIRYELMTAAHVSAVAELEKKYFSTPWSEKSISSELTNSLSVWLVALDEDRVVGYIGSQSVLAEADVMNIAVDESYRRQGVASGLVSALLRVLSHRQVCALLLEVRASNAPARAMYDKLGFVQVGRRPNYYIAPREDALILRKEWRL